MSLKEYKRKRTFSSTPEPKTKQTYSKKAIVLHFVVHKHNASRLHYDLRLELKGVLKSWAVPKGPSLNPNDKRLAMMVEDHPYDYKNFEGVIPRGNYGAGQVIIWDQGVYSSSETADPLKSEALLQKGLAKGHLSIIIQGEKLKGTFDLVKLPSDQKQNNSWLLIKRPDSYASTSDILKEDASVTSGLTIDDLKKVPSSVQENSKKVMRARKSLTTTDAMPHSVRPMLASSIDQPFDRAGWLFEIKWDGYRAIAEIQNGAVNLYSRNRISFIERYTEIVEDLQVIQGNFVLDGEIVVLDENSRPNFQYLQDYGDQKRGMLLYYVFDILFLNGKDLTSLTLRERKRMLKDNLPDLEHVKFSDHIENDGLQFFNLIKEQELEGMLAKDGNSPYRQNVRGSEWLKVKQRHRQEAVIGGFTEPRKGRGFLGALLLGVYEKGDLVYIGHTGGGFTDKGLKDMRARLDPLIIQKTPFKTEPIPNAPVHWIKPQYVCEVEFAGWTEDHHLRQPIFAGLREDKDPHDVCVEKPVEVQAVFQADPAEKKRVQIGNQEVIISNPSKLYFPAEKISKGDLVAYYEKISSIILPYLSDRPESLLRHPNGIEGASFFHKNMEDVPAWVKTVPIRSDTEEREIKYMICNDTETLVYMVNLGCIEINPWNSRLQSLDFPDYLVVDLDPEDIDFSHVITAALETKKFFDKVKMKSWCKTSGKTGLHIYVPMDAQYSYDQVRNFCEIAVRLIHKKLPKTTSIVRKPGERQGRVYLDFLQNRRGQTMAAPYSVRPVPGAPVSTPLKWSEVKKGLQPQNFTLLNIFERLQKYGDLWAPLLHERNDLEKALKLLPI